VTSGRQRILVIKLGALGDFVQAMGPMAAIRRHHGDAHIVLLTTAPFAQLGQSSGYFDDVWLDDRPPILAIRAWLRFRRRLREVLFERVYDLQTSDRSGWYFRLFWPGPWPEWSGIVLGCSHHHNNPERERMHTIDRQADQLRIAGIRDVGLPDVSWAKADLSRFALPGRYALLVPGASPHRPAKRWPLERYAGLAHELERAAIVPVILGTKADRPFGRAIVARAATARDLTGETNILEIITLARDAALAVGNDTGPMHLTAAAGCPSLVLFSGASDPALCAPRGARVTILRRRRLYELKLTEVLDALPRQEACS